MQSPPSAAPPTVSRLLSLVLFVTLISACYSLSLMQEPQILPPGKVRGSAGLTYQLDRFAYPAATLRVGLFPTAEARLKLTGGLDGLSGVEAGVNVQPYEGEAVAVFLMPHYRFFPHVEEDDDDFGDESFVEARRVHAVAMPSLLVVRVGAHRAFVGPDVHVGTRDRRGFAGLGGHAGFAINTARDHLSIVPEVSLLQIVAGRSRDVDEYGEGQSYLTRGDTLIELALGLSFGAKHATRATR